MHVAIIGSGPSAFYTAHRLLKRLPTVRISFFERLSQPFGLVRFGVAPDHAAVKRCTSKFHSVLQDSRVTLHKATHIQSLSEISDADAVVIAIGAECEKRLQIPGESHCLEEGFGLFSSRSVVQWYNGHPEVNADVDAALAKAFTNVHSLLIVGMGNVALDIVRLLGMARTCTKMEFPDLALNAASTLLKAVQLKRITVVGRRGMLETAFTAAELRHVVGMDAFDIELEPPILQTSLPAPSSKHQERMLGIWKSITPKSNAPLKLKFLFHSPPKEIVLSGDKSSIKGLVAGEECKFIEGQMIISSIGFTLRPDIFGLPQHNGRIVNDRGRVKEGIYVTGWCKSGPQGALNDTMASAYETADTLVADLTNKGVQ